MKYFLLIILICLSQMTIAQKKELDKLLAHADDYWHQGKYQKSLKMLRKILKKESRYYEAYITMALVYKDLGNQTKREEALKKSVKVAPKVLEVYERYGGYLEGNKRLLEAKELYKQGIEHLPQTADLHYYLGGVLYDLKKYPEALRAYEKAISLNATNSSYYFQRSYVFEGMGKYSEALKDFNQSILLNPKALTYSARADLKVEMKDYQGALADFQKAEELDSVGYKGLLRKEKDKIGRIYWSEADKLQKTDPEKALILAKQALEMLFEQDYLRWTKQLIKRLETQLTKQKAGDQFWAPYQKEYDQALELMQAKKYKEAFKILDKITKVVLKDDRYILHPFYEKASAAWDKCFKLKRLNLKKEDD